MTIQFVWTPLPSGIDANYLYFSLFISPQLTGGATVKDFPLVNIATAGLPPEQTTNWAMWAPALTFSVKIGGLTLPAERLTTANAPGRAWCDIDPAVWAAIFPITTTVDGYQYTDYSDATRFSTRSYSVRQVAGALNAVYNSVVLNSGATYPALDDPKLPLGEFLQSLNVSANFGIVPSQPGSRSDPADDDKLEGQFTDTGAAGGLGDPVTAYNFYRAYRFYRRSSRHKTDQYGPIDANAVPPRLPPPTPSFDKIVAALGDHPTLLRKLGLVLDFRVSRFIPGAGPPISIPNTGTIQAFAATTQFQLTVQNNFLITNYVLDPNGNGFFAAPTGGADVQSGMLRLDPKYYGVVQVDIDGTALKAIGHATNFAPILNAAKSAQKPAPRESLPARRSGGLTVVRDNRREQLVAQLTRATALHASLLGSGTATVGADDTYRGLRVDVEVDGTWYSLCQRGGTDTVAGTAYPLSPLDTEGYVKGSAVSRGDPTSSTTEQNTLYIHEALFGWHGWSLVARHPGRTVDPNDYATPPKLGFLPNAPAPGYPVVSEYRATKGTLPKLRFGKSYSFRARTVDLAGNSLPLGAATVSDAATQPVTYLRWEPVPAPAVVQRRKVTEGESLETVVIRSNPDPVDKLADLPMGKNATTYASTPAAMASGYLDYNDRHIAPPKTTQIMVETHSLIDGLAPQQAYNLSCKEAGTFIDSQIYDVTTGALVQLPAGELELLDPVQGSVALPTPGDVLGQGQYVVHTLPQLTLPYLPDPVAAGVTLAGVGAAGDVVVFARQPYRKGALGSWPDLLPFRLVLNEATSLTGAVTPAADTLTISLPPGEFVTLRYSSQPDPKHVQEMAVWNIINAAVANGTTPSTALDQANAGVNWSLTPFRAITLVHAVQRPLVKPAFYKEEISRFARQTYVTFRGYIGNDGRSTRQIEVNATWTDPTDLAGGPMTATTDHQAHAFRVDVQYADTLTSMGTPDGVAATPGKKHEFGDTKHRWVTYSPDGTTRYREYFPASITADPANLTTPGVTALHSIPASARPAPPDVAYIVPTFKWVKSDDGTKATRVGRGLRVYLNRPWYSSGADELLGVLLSPTPQVPTDTAKYVSEWGSDPVWSVGKTLSTIGLNDFDNRLTVDQHDATQPMSTGPFPLAELGSQQAAVAGFVVEPDVDRNLWFCDIEFAPTQSYSPFVRLALVRYQPYAVDGSDETSDMHLSRAVRTEFMQVLPDRGVTVTPNANHTFNVSVVGVSAVNKFGLQALNAPAPTPQPPTTSQKPTKQPVETGIISGLPPPVFVTPAPRAGAGKRVTAQFEKRPKGSTNDLLWAEVGSAVALPSYHQSIGTEVAWSGQVRLPTNPDAAVDYRLVVREAEVFATDGDVADSIEGGPNAERVVFFATFPVTV